MRELTLIQAAILSRGSVLTRTQIWELAPFSMKWHHRELGCEAKGLRQGISRVC